MGWEGVVDGCGVGGEEWVNYINYTLGCRLNWVTEVRTGLAVACSPLQPCDRSSKSLW